MNSKHIDDKRLSNFAAMASRVTQTGAPWLKLAGISVLMAAGTHSLAQDTQVAAPAPTEAASGPSAGASLMDSLGSFFKRVKDAIPDAKPVDPDNAQGAGQDRQEGLDLNAKTKESASRGDAKVKPAFNIIDIESWSSTSDTVLDPQCKTMMQPFGMTDNLASLAALAAKIKITEYVSKLGPAGSKPATGATQGSTAEIIRMAARNLNWLPMEAEVALGKTMMSESEILEENKNKESRRVYTEARKVLAEILKDIPGPLPYDFQVKVLTKSYGGASALPGGIIMVDLNLFKKGADQDYTFFVMAHEVAHVLQRHQTRAYQAKMVDGLNSIEGLQKLMSAASGPNPGAVLAYGSALKKLFVSFSEAQELQADSCAVRMLHKRNPNSSILQAKLLRVDKGLGAPVPEVAEGPQGNSVVDHFKYLGDGVMERHPTTNKRKVNLQLTFTTLTAQVNLSATSGQAPTQK